MSNNTASVKLPPVILLDIEGTTTSISFVKDVLFPYAKKGMEQYIRTNWKEDDWNEIYKLLQLQSDEDVKNGLCTKPLPLNYSSSKEKLQSTNKDEEILKNILEYLYQQIDSDRKTTGLKVLQGKIWNAGYQLGLLKGHVYEDVSMAFEKWVSSEKKLYIYSSGSIEAQIALFRNSSEGDLTKFLSGHFDTTSGPKIDSQSYLTISSKIGVEPSDILFFTDIAKEAYAAKDAGLQVVLMIRPGNQPLTLKEMKDFMTANSFDQFAV